MVDLDSERLRRRQAADNVVGVAPFVAKVNSTGLHDVMTSQGVRVRVNFESVPGGVRVRVMPAPGLW